MFLDLNDLKGLIVDLDSIAPLEDQYWAGITPRVKCSFLSSDQGRLDSIKNQNTNVSTAQVCYFDIFSNVDVLSHYLFDLQFASNEVAVLTGKMETIKDALAFPIGTILLQEIDFIKYEHAGHLLRISVASGH